MFSIRFVPRLFVILAVQHCVPNFNQWVDPPSLSVVTKSKRGRGVGTNHDPTLGTTLWGGCDLDRPKWKGLTTQEVRLYIKGGWVEGGTLSRSFTTHPPHDHPTPCWDKSKVRVPCRSQYLFFISVSQSSGSEIWTTTTDSTGPYSGCRRDQSQGVDIKRPTYYGLRDTNELSRLSS